jgi:geranylgeranyl diphosphate synthase type II
MNMDLNQLVQKYRQEIDTGLAELYLPVHPASLYAPINYSAVTSGKRFRPILTFLTGEGLGVPHAKILPVALAVEILHTFTLVHDDIMDNDTQRRGCATIHVKWDTNTAILTGDGLMAIAFRSLMECDAPRLRQMGYEFSQSMLEICEGQALDMEYEKSEKVTAEDYLYMVSKKTGRLLGLSCQLGALLSSADEKIANDLNCFGIELGQAFQIQDDLLEITSDTLNMGKSLDSDIVAGKKTYPLIVAQSAMDQKQRQEFIALLKTQLNDRTAIIGLFQEHLALDLAQQKIAELLQGARNRLRHIPEPAADYLSFAIDLISRRQR